MRPEAAIRQTVVLKCSKSSFQLESCKSFVKPNLPVDKIPYNRSRGNIRGERPSMRFFLAATPAAGLACRGFCAALTDKDTNEGCAWFPPGGGVVGSGGKQGGGAIDHVALSVHRILA